MRLSLARPRFLKISSVVLHLILLLFLYPLSGIAAEKEVLIGVLAKRGVEYTLQKWQPTADYLSQEIPGYHFSIKPLDFDAVSPAVATAEVDFILANPSFYVGLEINHGVKRIATLRNRVGETITSQFASVIFSRADHDKLKQLQDLKGLTLMAVDKNSLGGFHMAWWELQLHDIDPYEDLRRLEFGGTHDAVVYAVLKGDIDAGIVRTDTLERMAQEGKIDLIDIKIINQHTGHDQADYPFLHSTQIYPEWPFASLASTPFELTQTVAITLLRMSPESDAAIAAKSAGWGVPLNYQSVHELLKTLRVGIYQDFGKISLWDVLRLYWYWLLLGVVALIVMAAVTTHIIRLNTRLNISHLDLHEARNDMEVRVIQRTQELEQTNITLHGVIKEHKQTLQRLRQTSYDKQLLLDSAGEGIYGIDNNGRVYFINAHAVNRLGWSEEELIGHTIHTLAHHTRADGEPYPFEACPIHTTLRQNKAHSVSDEIFWCKDGSSFPVEYTATPILEDGKQMGAVVVFRDVTERRKTEEALRRTQKMDALGKLTGGIAHDFNNMLGVILGFSELLLHNVGNEPKLEKYAKQIHRAGERAKVLTARLLAFSRKEAAGAELADINQLILDEQHMLEKMLTARIELVMDLADDLWPVWIDKASMEDAILNMGINAMHAIPERGSLTLATSNIHLEKEEMRQMSIEPGDYVLIAITDNGVGMDQETQQHIFDPFFSTKGEQGTGLGMSQVYGFVQQSGGDIHIESEVGHGTCIEIYFPRYYQTTIHNASEEINILEDSPSGHETILVVDDEPALCGFIEEVLVAHGYRVLCANGGEEALKILEAESIDLLFSDVIMPDMDGYQLAEKVEREYPQVKIQIASGFSDERHLGKNEMLHKQRLIKPFDSETLLQRIRELLNGDKIVSELERLHPIEWSEGISTGIEQIDNDHKILLALLNRCIDAVGGGKQDEVLSDILEELLEYVGYHFRREEEVMAVCNYPNLRSHKQEHEWLVDSVNQRVIEFSNGELSMESLLDFLQNWLIKHIVASDKEIIPCCHGKETIIEQALAEAGLSHSSDE